MDRRATAWIADDAYISFRSSVLLAEGHGLRFNVDERVQAFTNPLWTLLVGAAYAVTGEVYFTALALGASASLVVFTTLVARASRTGFAAALLTVVAFVGSRAFVDYSTSGLENPLAHLLWVALVFTLARATCAPRWTLALLLTSLLLANRMDSALLAGPLLAAYAVRTRSLPRPRDWLLGSTPFVLWLVFAAFYYGSLLPNTAHAKLAGQPVPQAVLTEHGIAYLRLALRTDPVTVLALALVLVRGVWGALRLARRSGSRWTALSDLAVGTAVALHTLYVVRVGGDFMAGRFLAAPFVVTVAASVTRKSTRHIARVATKQVSAAPSPHSRAVHAAGTLVLLLLACRLPDHPLRTGPGFRVTSFAPYGMTDERAFYYPYRGLLRSAGLPGPEQRRPGLEAGSGRSLGVCIALGSLAFRSGESAQVVDEVGLADPLLARMSPRTRGHFRVGHVMRRFPSGYLLSLWSDANRLADPDLAAYYADLRLVTRAVVRARAAGRTGPAAHGRES